MNVVGTVGLPGSGKGEAAAVASELDIPVVTMGDVIRKACRARGLDPADHHGEIAVALRDEHGPGAIADRSLERVRDALETHDTVLIDGIRSDAEVERFVEAFGDAFTLVAITAPFEVRKERLAERQRDDPDAETLEERDDRERGFGTDTAIEMADETIENTDSIEAYHKQVRRLLESDE